MEKKTTTSRVASAFTKTNTTADQQARSLPTSFQGSSPSRPVSRSWGRKGEDPGNEVGLLLLLNAVFSRPQAS